MSKILKKNTAGDFFINDMGITIPGNGQLTIDPNQYYLLQASADVVVALTNNDLIYNDGSNDLDLNDAIEHIKNYFYKSPLDPDTGMPSVSTRKLPDGWYPEFREVEFETSKLNSIHDKDSSDANLNEHIIKFLDSGQNELVNPTQATLDSSCEWTILEFDPARAWAIRGSYTRQLSIPASPVYIWNAFRMLIDPAPVYLDWPCANGGLNMEFQDVRESVGDEGENFSFFTSNDSIIWRIKHNAGFNHRIRIIYKLAFEVGS